MVSFLHKENKQSLIWFKPFPFCKAHPSYGPLSPGRDGSGPHTSTARTSGCLRWLSLRVLSRFQAQKFEISSSGGRFEEAELISLGKGVSSVQLGKRGLLLFFLLIFPGLGSPSPGTLEIKDDSSLGKDVIADWGCRTCMSSGANLGWQN